MSRSNYLCIGALLILPLAVLAGNPINTTVPDGGAGVVAALDQHSAAQDARLYADIEQARALLLLQGKLPPFNNKGVNLLDWPLRLRNGLDWINPHGISNFVDLDATFPNKLRDYQCGTRTYDLASGYNHRGIDIFTWPYSWLNMDRDSVEVIAARDGILLSKRDGQFDRNCAIDNNAIANSVVVQHADATVSMYFHLKNGSVTSAALGSVVRTGDYLGLVGSSGSSTGPHLHLELRANQTSNAAVIDPFAGQCNNVASLWQNQRPYNDSGINLLATHDAPPESRTCPQAEIPHYRSVYRPGESVLFTTYYRDQLRNQVTQYRVKNPQGQDLYSWSGSLSDRDHYAASYWYWTRLIPSNSPAGTYTFQVDYEGRQYKQNFLVGPAAYQASGAWYNPAQSGHGLMLEILPGATVPKIWVTWFTYLQGKPRWLFGIADVTGDDIRVPLSISSGAQFPPNFNSNQVQFTPWGEVTLRFSDINNGTLNWTSSVSGFGSGTMPIAKLVGMIDDDKDHLNAQFPACTSGSWYNPNQSGHGVLLETTEIDGKRSVFATWYTYLNGEQVWLTGTGEVVADGVVIDMISTSGAQAPPNFNANDVVRTPWGRATFNLVDSDNALWSWQPTQAGYTSGSMPLSRLSRLAEAPCR